MSTLDGAECNHELVIRWGLVVVLLGLGVPKLVPSSFDKSLEEVRISLRKFQGFPYKSNGFLAYLEGFVTEL